MQPSLEDFGIAQSFEPFLTKTTFMGRLTILNYAMLNGLRFSRKVHITQSTLIFTLTLLCSLMWITRDCFLKNFLSYNLHL